MKTIRAAVAAAAFSMLSFAAPTEAAGLDDLIAAAKKEGQLTVIALPRDWCGYGALIDVGLSFGPGAKAEGLLLPYKVATWGTIPNEAKDPDGYWTGDYYGVLSFAVNADLVKSSPADWSDLLKPEFKSAVALAGDPRASNQATMGVYAAGLAGGATDAAKAVEDGLKFFAELNKSG